jgi:NADPH2:quinone reductase
MKAIRVHSFGGPEVLSYEDTPRPEPGHSEVLLRVTGTGINPVDWKTRAGRGVNASLPYIPGWDVSGVVEASDSKNTAFHTGEAVFGLVRFPKPGSTYAEYTAVPADEIVAKPESLTSVEAAALPLTGLTAWQGLVETTKVAAGQRVLVLGASGGVGHLAIQIAKARGAHVIGTASESNAAFLRDLGIDEVLDYHQTRIEESLRDIDVIFDTVGGHTLQQAVPVVKAGGTIVSIAGSPETGQTRSRGIHTHRILVHPEAAHLRELVALVNAGKLRVVIESVFPLREASKAHTVQEQGHVRGKLVLDPTQA